MKNNKGFSLVELLVAIAVAAIVTAGIASLMMQSLSMYSKETVNAKLQTDLQTASNYLFDSVMESKGFIIINDTTNSPTVTRFALLGDFSGEGGAYKVENGYLYIADSNLQAGSSGSIYLSEYSYPHSGSTGASLDVIAKDISDHYVKVNDGTEGVLGKEENVLVNNVTKFLLKPSDGVLNGIEETDSTNKSFGNPISLDVKITFEKTSNFGKVITKNIEEAIDMRNTIKSNVYYSTISLNPNDTYHLYTTAKLNKIKTDVNAEMMLAKNPGEISIQSGGGAKSGTINILEILPDESYDYLQFVIGGKNGECLAEGGTIDPGEFEAYICQTNGYTSLNDKLYNNSAIIDTNKNSIYVNNDPNVPAIAFADKYLDGYYEYVGPNQGNYAINYIEEYSGAMEILNKDDGSGEYYIPREVSEGKMDYEKLTERYQPDPYNPWSAYDRDIYRYVGDGNGNVNIEFDKQNWFRGDWSYKPINPDDNIVKSISMYSKYYTGTPGYSSDYGFIWKEASHDEETKVSDIKDGLDVGERIYIKDHHRCKVANNELFRIYVMQNLMETCLPTGYNKLDITKGIWDVAANDYCTPNYEAVLKWNSFTDNKIGLSAKVARDVSVSDVENADMIVFATADGGFASAQQTYCKIKNVSASGDTAYNATNDISFDVVKAIYKRVIDEKASIACPTDLTNSGSATLNVHRIVYMLYGIKDLSKNLSDSSEPGDKERENKINDGKDYWSDDTAYQSAMPYTLNGNGRRMYAKYLDDMSDATAADRDDLKYFYQINNSFNYDGERNNTSSNITNVGTSNVNIPPGGFIYGKVYSEDASFKYTYCQMGLDLDAGKNFGIYRNQLMWNNTSNLLHFDKTGATGLLGLQSIFKATQDEDSVDIPIGNIYVEGACATGHERTFGINATANSRGSAVDTEWYETNAVTYESKAVIINKGEADERAIIYLNEQEYEVAKTQGLDIYCVVKSKDACANGDTYVYQNESNKRTASTHQDYKNGTLTNETHIREFKYHLTVEDLAGIAIGSKKDYVAYAKIAASEGIADGEAKFSIVVRDLFNLN